MTATGETAALPRDRAAGGLRAAGRGLAARLARPPADALVPRAPGIAWALGTVAAVLAAAAMLAIAAAFAGGRLAAEAGGEAAGIATLSVLADEAAVEDQARAALAVLRDTEGVLAVRVLEAEEQRALLAPWLGTAVPAEGLTLPLMIEVETDRARLDAAALVARLAEAAPAAVLDDHAAWRAPVADWGRGLMRGAFGALALAALALGAAAGLAAAAGFAAARQAALVLAGLGAPDGLVAGVLARRAGRAALLGAAAGAGGTAALLAGQPAGPAVPLALGLGAAGSALALPVALAAAALAGAVTAAVVRRRLRREA